MGCVEWLDCGIHGIIFSIRSDYMGRSGVAPDYRFDDVKYLVVFLHEAEARALYDSGGVTTVVAV